MARVSSPVATPMAFAHVSFGSVPEMSLNMDASAPLDSLTKEPPPFSAGSVSGIWKEKLSFTL
jgi:hypothetical protein